MLQSELQEPTSTLALLWEHIDLWGIFLTKTYANFLHLIFGYKLHIFLCVEKREKYRHVWFKVHIDLPNVTEDYLKHKVGNKPKKTQKKVLNICALGKVFEFHNCS